MAYLDPYQRPASDRFVRRGLFITWPANCSRPSIAGWPKQAS